MKTEQYLIIWLGISIIFLLFFPNLILASNSDQIYFYSNKIDTYQDRTIARGKIEFEQFWAVNPTPKFRWGRGPQSNAPSCAKCHNRSPDFKYGLVARLFYLNNKNPREPKPHPVYGSEISTRGVLGQLIEEGNFKITYEKKEVVSPKGRLTILRKPTFALTQLWYGAIGPQTIVSLRIATRIAGVNALEKITTNQISEISKIQNKHGVNGKPNLIWSPKENIFVLGRYGSKASQSSLEKQIALAFYHDMGLTSKFFPNNNCPKLQIGCKNVAFKSKVEVSEHIIDEIASYLKSATGSRQSKLTESEKRGKNIFRKAKCSICHIPKFITEKGESIFAFTDLMLHDMGEGLSDGVTEFLAGPRDWKTTSLIGIGEYERNNKVTLYLHDGRARNLSEAILWHGGEAKFSQILFQEMSDLERKDLLAFLRTL